MEHPLLSRIYEAILNGNYEELEKMLQAECHDSMFQEHVESLSYKPFWKRLHPAGERPCMRGGHQMCIDSEDKKIYLFGGWDGQQDLADFWIYDIPHSSWKCISKDTRLQNGPCPRSCHKIAFFRAKKQIWVLGKYVDPETRANTQLNSDFFCFDIRKGEWIKISEDTKCEDGPELLYDHQMVIDEGRGEIYVFGGRVICSSDETIYSGLYRYSITTKQWTLIRADDKQSDGSVQMKSRIGHSMIFNEKSRELYVFAGQRHKDYLKYPFE